MLVLRSLWEGIGKEAPPPVVYWTLRILMFTLSFVLEDWALQELVHETKQRRVALILVASSYVTWTYQTHTFSNSIETLVVLWSLVLIARIVQDRVRRSGYMRSGQRLTDLTGTFRSICLRRASLFDRPWSLQSHYVPSLHRCSGLPIASSFQTETISTNLCRSFWLPDSKLRRAPRHCLLPAERQPPSNCIPKSYNYASQQSPLQLRDKQSRSSRSSPYLPACSNQHASIAWTSISPHLHKPFPQDNADSRSRLRHPDSFRVSTPGSPFPSTSCPACLVIGETTTEIHPALH